MSNLFNNLRDSRETVEQIIGFCFFRCLTASTSGMRHEFIGEFGEGVEPIEPRCPLGEVKTVVSEVSATYVQCKKTR